LAYTLKFNFSKTFTGVVWTTLAVPERNVLIIEARDEASHEARFSAIDYQKGEFLWQNVLLEESWWVGLTAATPDVLLFHLYHSTENPDDKGLIAYDINQQKILWQYDHFSFACLGSNAVQGYFTDQEMKTASVSLNTGQILEQSSSMKTTGQNISLRRPFQYAAGQKHFETVAAFLEHKLDVKPVTSVEYLEYNELIFVSYYIQENSLANYLVVLQENGAIVQQKKMDDGLKGLGLDTFFILSGCLFFVRNKCELVSYRIV